MKLTSKIIFLIITGVFIGACTPAPNPNTLVPESPRTEAEYDSREIREDVITRSRSRYDGPVCNKTSGRIQDDCEKICRELYRRSGDRESCELLEVDLIDDLEKMYEILEDAKDRGNGALDEIDSELFNTYVHIGIASLDSVIGDYNSSKAENFLYWLIDNEAIGEVFRSEDDDHKTLEEVLRQLDSDYSNKTGEIHKIFDESIGEYDLMELIVTTSDVVIEWFMDFINEKNSDCKKSTRTKKCFVDVYCQIGDLLDDENQRADWLSNDVFKKYLDKIIDKKVNSRDADEDDEEKYNMEGWSKDDVPIPSGNARKGIEDADDLEDWYEDLCEDWT